MSPVHPPGYGPRQIFIFCSGGALPCGNPEVNPFQNEYVPKIRATIFDRGTIYTNEEKLWGYNQVPEGPFQNYEVTLTGPVQGLRSMAADRVIHLTHTPNGEATLPYFPLDSLETKADIPSKCIQRRSQDFRLGASSQGL